MNTKLVEKFQTLVNKVPKLPHGALVSAEGRSDKNKLKLIGKAILKSFQFLMNALMYIALVAFGVPVILLAGGFMAMLFVIALPFILYDGFVQPRPRAGLAKFVFGE